MKNITINFAAQTIEMTQSFANAASKYGSSAYMELISIKRDFPHFEVTTIKPSKKVNAFKGLDINFMEEYISGKDGAESDEMKEFNILRGKTDDKFAAKATFGEIKVWFLAKYPEFENARANIDAIVAQAKETHKQRNKARETRKAA